MDETENIENIPTEDAADQSAEPQEAYVTAPLADAAAPVVPKRRRQEKIGLVTSDKMTKTVVVRVERQVQHPKYRRYIRRRSKFMAHDEMGAGIGDIVRIVETRPLSARKRWRVVEIVQKAR
jgi:small subunit ribosomal protein S17